MAVPSERPQEQQVELPAAGWYANPDPSGTGYRYWDGRAWTGYYYAGAEQAQPATAVVVAEEKSGKHRLFPQRQKSGVPAQTSAATEPPTIDSVLAQVRLEAPRKPLDEQIEVAGEHFYAKQIRQVFALHRLPITKHGVTLEQVDVTLMPEPWNPYDPNAVAVLVGRHQIGHIPADLARDYAAPLGALAASGVLATGVARIWAQVDSVGVLRARATLLIAEADRY